MKNNRFSFIAINESSNDRFSFSISSLFLKFIIISVIGLTMFFLYLTINTYNQKYNVHNHGIPIQWGPVDAMINYNGNEIEIN